MGAVAQARPLGSREQVIIDQIIEASKKKNIEPAVALAVAENESSFNPRARRREKKLKTSSLGIFQVLVTTARLELGFTGQDSDLYDPEINIRLGLAYISRCYEEAGRSLKQLACCYTGGIYAEPWVCRTGPVRKYHAALQARQKYWRDYLKTYRVLADTP